jgi:ArsR family transcriptional regulator
MDISIYLKALADPTRIRLSNILFFHELSVNEIVSIMDMGQSRISRHLKILTDAGILKCRRDGVWAFYSTSDSGGGKEIMNALSPVMNLDPVLEADLKKSDRILEKRRKNTANFFDHVAPKWDTMKKELLGNFDLNKAVTELMENCNTSLDLGCGTGELLCHMAPYSQKIIGVDCSPEMLGEAETRLRNKGYKADLRLGELEHLPMRDHEADLAVISMVLHHLTNPEEGIREVSRILEPGGIFVFAEFGKHNLEKLRTDYGDRWLGFDHDYMEKILEKNGFRITVRKEHSLSQGLSLNIIKSVKSF